jgi:hypothetical protein
MGRGTQTFKQSDLTRALKATKAAGVGVARIEIAKDGTIAIDIGDATAASDPAISKANDWDEAVK